MVARLRVVLLVVVATQSVSAGNRKSPGEAPGVPIGSTVADFTLDDFRGKPHRLSDHAKAPVVVLAVLGTECPLAKLYATRLQELSDRYAAKGVVFLGLNANSQDSITEIGSFAERHKLTFPILKDLNQTVVDAVGATRTPEVVVLDHKRTVRYRGRIDDRYGIGYTKGTATEDYLQAAIDALLTGKPVAKSEVESLGCLIGRSKPPQGPSETTFTSAVAAVLNRHCVECHREGEIAPFPLTDFESASGWAEMIAEVVRENRMPPWNAAEPVDGTTSHDGAVLSYADNVAFANHRGLSEEERQILYDWAAAGAPRGTGEAPQATVDTVTGWHLPAEPDAVFEMAGTPFTVPAEGTVDYQYFRVETKLTEDKWIRGAEILPGNRAVVHHVLVFAKPRGRTDPRGVGNGEFLAAYVPGMKAVTFPPGMAKLVPAGADLLFQIHYTPVGSPQNDTTRIGLLYADRNKIDHLVETRAVIDEQLEIKPNESDQKIEVRGTIPYESARLLALMPHMHLRGQAFRYTLERGSKKETLLDVPSYDFNWQTCYRLETPVPLSKGDRIAGAGWFDNSASNLANPDPSATVRWGDQSWEEMLIGYYDVAIPLSDDEKIAVRSGKFTHEAASGELDKMQKAIRDRVRETFDRFDANDSGTLSRDEIPERLRRIHSSIDTDNNSLVDQVEMRRAYLKQERRMQILNASGR